MASLGEIQTTSTLDSQSLAYSHGSRSPASTAARDNSTSHPLDRPGVIIDVPTGDELVEQEMKFKFPPVWTRMPNTAFGVGMGLAGQAILWKVAGKALETGFDAIANKIFWICSFLISLVIFCAYAYKTWFYFPLVMDEINNGTRVHFFNMPHLILVMLSLGVPDDFMAENFPAVAAKRIIWVLGFSAQIMITYNIYESWLFSEHSNISCARPQFLLSTVGWFLLANLGASVELEQNWGLPLPSFCFGVGIMFYLMVVNAIFNGIHVSPKAKGSPALFLIIAPPSVGVVAYDNIVESLTEPSVMSEVLFGWSLGILLLLFKLGPKIFQHPPTFGAYWAYVFPSSALATASLHLAWLTNSRSFHAMSVILIVCSTSATFLVFCREFVHSIAVMRGKAEWGDPLLSKDKLQAASERFVYSEVVETVETA